MELFKIENLSFTYPSMEKKALNDIKLDVKSGEFITICGKSGCGKSTLLRQLKTVLCPYGEKTGAVLFEGKNLNDIDQREQASKIGFVLQNVESQIVTDKVWHELAFGLESLGFDNKTIRLRVAEMASFFGIGSWFHKNVNELSGGQKQLLNLASIMAMQPSVLILDEPTSQLDPIAASEFLETLAKINREIGTTIIITEHRLEEVLSLSTRLVVMKQGEILYDDIPERVGEKLKNSMDDMFNSMPSPMQIYAHLETDLKCPITVKDGREFLSQFVEGKSITNINQKASLENENKDVVIKLKEVYFKYEKNGEDVIKNLSFEVFKGETFAIVGGNGSGKTTALSLISTLNIPYSGKVEINGKNIAKYKKNELFFENLGVLPQNPQSLFVEKTVYLDLMNMFDDKKLSNEQKDDKIREIAKLIEIEHILQQHPFDLSGGEQQRAALAKVLLLNPKILLLDEPTKGIDNHFKFKLMDILNKLKFQGVTVVLVSHDIEFCANFADRCGMFFDGSLITVNNTNEFFSGNSFYTTAANRMSRHIFKNTVTNKDVIFSCYNLTEKN
jgi:energy-coupling factor transporter ATP-binding protein EcfA2